ncbi:Rrf2 family transcriptional regulator [Robertmurraya sp. DFI.2.37]|uniref:Rrf2 family transcriptional regulator n=1 Tax=Robertmurraya TaxID=2837507 RepID=UPI000BA57AAC|nr:MULTISPECIES: Rrf2 family transcriptional regulator [Robertmurraya]MDF1508792.1 Rrf2 family transcriptional regulator [Robertmurraya sp. DFI.2.37]PAE21031.1 transcriptional regulator [Bacillus sp. 7504-2]
MKYSRATDYALHTMLFLAQATPRETISVHKLAERQNVSPTYLSKILTKLVKAGMIESLPGVNGGYKLKSNWENISFLDVIHAIEGSASLFDCSFDHGPQCPIQRVVEQAEKKMEDYLKSMTIAALAKEAQC